jgi:DNA-binding response OmpR family regulator
MSKVLLIEDDADIRRLVADALAAAGHSVESASAAMEGLQAAIAIAPDLIILDLGLPDLDGADLLRMIRAISKVPVIVATARSGEAEMVRLLDAGADDYLVKPFTTQQLLARLRAVLRRTAEGGRAAELVVGGLRIDPAARRVTLDGEPIELSPKEFDLLRVLAERAGEVVERRDLMAEVWRQPFGGMERTLDVHLSWLRRKLGESASEPRYIQTVHGVGVRLAAP